MLSLDEKLVLSHLSENTPETAGRVVNILQNHVKKYVGGIIETMPAGDILCSLESITDKQLVEKINTTNENFTEMYQITNQGVKEQGNIQI